MDMPVKASPRRARFCVRECDLNNPKRPGRQTAVIRAELVGSDSCSALGVTVESSTPVLELCRALVDAGHNPATPLEAYRGDVLCLRVRSIREAAQLAVRGNGVGLEAFRSRRAAPPVRRNGGGGR